MRFKIGDLLPFRAVFRESKLGKIGLTVLVYVYDPDDILILDGVAAREIGHGLYGYDMSGALNTKAGVYTACFETATTTVDSRSEWSLWAVGGWVENLDASISSIATAITGVAAAVWAYASRTLTQSAAQVIAVLSGDTLTLTRGTTWSISLTGLGSLVSNTKIYFTIKTDTDETDAESTVQVEKSGGLLVLNGTTTTTSNATLTVTDINAGDITIVVKPAATTTVSPSNFVYDVKMVKSDGTVQALTNGIARVTDHITRAIT